MWSLSRLLSRPQTSQEAAQTLTPKRLFAIMPGSVDGQITPPPLPAPSAGRVHINGKLEMTTTVIYGIKNCDTVKKARAWLTQQGIDYRFVDVREDGISQAQVEQWIERSEEHTSELQSRPQLV